MDEDMMNTSDIIDEDSTFEIKNDVQKALVDTFSLFATENTISVEDVDKIIYHIGCVPSEEELNEIVTNVKMQNDPNRVALKVFVPYMEKQILALRYKPATEDELLKAFQTLDTENKGSFSIDYLKQTLLEEGTLTEDEIVKEIKTVYDPDYDHINYRFWIRKLLGRKRMNVYAMIPADDGNESVRRRADEDELLNLRRPSSSNAESPM